MHSKRLVEAGDATDDFAEGIGGEVDRSAAPDIVAEFMLGGTTGDFFQQFVVGQDDLENANSAAIPCVAAAGTADRME